jgi:translation initiation factor eIF-2B subunit alpha
MECLLSVVDALADTTQAATITGLAQELTLGRQRLVDTQSSLGVRAGCQLWERFFAISAGGEEFPNYKRSLIAQGRSFCSVTAPQCRQKIADMAVGFLRDDCTVRLRSEEGSMARRRIRCDDRVDPHA